MSVNGRAYTPPPGSTPGRALAFLQSQPTRDAELSTSALAEGSGVPAGGFVGAMQPALNAGLVFARKKGGHLRSPLFWSLVDHEAKEGNTPQGANRAATRFEGRGPQGPDATDREARSKVMALDGSESPTGRGSRSTPALGAAPAFHSPGPRGTAASTTGDCDDDEGDSGCARRLAGGSDADQPQCGGRADHGQQDDGGSAHDAGLLRAQPWRVAHQGTAECAGPGDDRRLSTREYIAAIGADDPAPEVPGAALVGRTATLSMTGEVAVVAECGTVILFDAQRGRQLVTWLAGRAG